MFSFAPAVFVLLVAILFVACTGRGGDNAISPESPLADVLADADMQKAAGGVDGGGWGGGPPVGPLGGGPELPGGGCGSPSGVSDPENDPFESAEWVIIPFTDPRDNSTYDIVDGRVLLALTNPPVFPVMDPNYFDVQLPLDDPYYQLVNYSNMMVGGVATDPAVQAFLVAENLTVYSEWPEVGGMAVQLPPGQTVLDAVTNWVTEYPLVLLAVDPDAIFESCSFPDDKPNDDQYGSSWHLKSDNNLHLPPWINPQMSLYSADPSSAWGLGEDALGNGVVIAIIDSG